MGYVMTIGSARPGVTLEIGAPGIYPSIVSIVPIIIFDHASPFRVHSD